MLGIAAILRAKHKVSIILECEGLGYEPGESRRRPQFGSGNDAVMENENEIGGTLLFGAGLAAAVCIRAVAPRRSHAKETAFAAGRGRRVRSAGRSGAVRAAAPPAADVP
jgi:hypothetical protein